MWNRLFTSYNIINVIYDFLTGNLIKVSNEIIQKRINHCRSCKHLFMPTLQCKKCGCFISKKVKYAKSSCPVDTWASVEV